MPFKTVFRKTEFSVFEDRDGNGIIRLSAENRAQLFHGRLTPVQAETLDISLLHRDPFDLQGIALLELADDISHCPAVFTAQIRLQGGLAAAIFGRNDRVKAQIRQFRTVPDRIGAILYRHLGKNASAEGSSVFEGDFLDRLPF